MERERAEQPPSDDGSVLDGPLPWVLLGVGVAGVGVGLGLGAGAKSKHDDAAEEPVQLDAVSKQRSAEDLATGANIAIVAGASVAAIGGVLAVIGLASSGTEETPPAAASWQLRVGPDFFGIDGRF
jgi:hypothetical protein